MLLTNPIIDSETRRRRALAKVYSLLIRLAEEDTQKTILLEDHGCQAIDVREKSSNPRNRKLEFPAPNNKHGGRE